METRFLVASDLHGSGMGLAAIIERLERDAFDAVLISGDITHFGPMEFARMALEDMAGLGVEVFFVGGNCDPKDIERLKGKAVGKMGGSYRSLHRRGVTYRGLGLVGHGGSTGHSGTPGEYDEEEVAGGLKEALAGLRADRGKGRSPVDVLVTHAPAKGSLDEVPSGERIGSAAVAKFAKQAGPALALSGHVHEARGVMRKGGTVFVNPGPLRMAYMAEAVVRVDDDGVSAEARLLD